MAQTNGLRQETRQKINITMAQLAPELEKNDIAMAETVKNELASNGALEQKEGKEEHETKEDFKEKEMMKQESGDPEDAKYEKAEDDYQRYFSGGRNDSDFYTPVVVSEETLEEHLMGQLNQENSLTDTEKKIAEYIIGNLDSNGWLGRSTEDIADDLAIKEGLDVYSSDVEKVLEHVQELDPVGVACTSLQECILLQLEEKDGKNPANLLAYKIVNEYFTDFAKKHFERIYSKLNITAEQLSEAYQVILKTNPRPGAGYSSGSSDIHREQISPDFEITIENDKITCTLPNRIPELQISTTYQGLIEKSLQDKKYKESKDYKRVKDEYDRGRKFIKLLEMRQMKLQAVMGSIISHQENYFLSGDTEDLRPLTYRDITKDTGLDLSVISRVCKDKYVTTPWGVKKLRYFFSEGLGDIPPKAVQEALKELIDGEDKRKPYSDGQLAKLLQEKYGYDISRRTVAKYREGMNIPDSRNRKVAI